jgi:hypothetical protein
MSGPAPVSKSNYLGASESFDGSPWGPCFAVGAALGEPFGLSFPERVPLIPVVACAPLRIAPPAARPAPLPTRSEPTALPRGSVLPPWAEASVVLPMSMAASTKAVRRLFCIIVSSLEFRMHPQPTGPLTVPNCGSHRQRSGKKFDWNNPGREILSGWCWIHTKESKLPEPWWCPRLPTIRLFFHRLI